MSSQAQSLAPLRGVRGLVFLGFPLHPAGKPSTERAAHLADVHVPMLFIQGTNDALANRELLRGVVERLGVRATLELFADADHSFHVPARSGRNDAEVRVAMIDAIAAPSADLSPSLQELQDFYRDNSALFSQSDQVRARQVWCRVPTLADAGAAHGRAADAARRARHLAS